MSSTSDKLHFGLGNDSLADSLIIRWPGMLEQKMIRVKADQTLVLDIADARMAASGGDIPAPAAIFRYDSIPGLRFRHPAR